MGCCHGTDLTRRVSPACFHLSRDGVEIIQFNLSSADYKCMYSWDSPILPAAKYCGLPSGQLLVVGGKEEKQPGKPRKSSNLALIFDPSTELFTPKPRMTLGRDGHCLALEGRAVYVLSGASCGEFTITCERFDTVEETWEDIEPLPEARVEASACVVKQRIYVTGGYTEFGSAMKVMFYCIPVGQWITAPFKMPVDLRYHGSAEYKNGVLVFGGMNVDGGPNVDTFWFCTRQNRVLQKSILPVGAIFPCQCASTGDRVFACESDSGRTIFLFQNDQWRLQNIPLADKDPGK